MALIRFTNQTIKPLPHDKALAIWNVLNGTVEPTEEQAAFIATVERVYLDWRKAPADYLEKYADTLNEMERSLQPRKLKHPW